MNDTLQQTVARCPPDSHSRRLRLRHALALIVSFTCLAPASSASARTASRRARELDDSGIVPQDRKTPEPSSVTAVGGTLLVVLLGRNRSRRSRSDDS